MEESRVLGFGGLRPNHINKSPNMINPPLLEQSNHIVELKRTSIETVVIYHF